MKFDYNKYLVVKYGDNDFAYPVFTALEQLWTYINSNNNGPVLKKPNKHYSGKTTSQIIETLYAKGILINLLRHLYCLEYLKGKVEHKTRGLYWSHVDWEETDIKEPDIINFKNDYLTFDLELRKDNEFKQWENGEVAYLNLETGNVKIL